MPLLEFVMRFTTDCWSYTYGYG